MSMPVVHLCLKKRFFIDNQIGEIAHLDQVADFERCFFLLKKRPQRRSKRQSEFLIQSIEVLHPRFSWSLESWVFWGFFSPKNWRTAISVHRPKITQCLKSGFHHRWFSIHLNDLGFKTASFRRCFGKSYSTHADWVLMNPVEMIKNIYSLKRKPKNEDVVTIPVSFWWYSYETVMNDMAERIKNNWTLQNKSKVLRMMKDDILSPKFWAGN